MLLAAIGRARALHGTGGSTLQLQLQLRRRLQHPASRTLGTTIDVRPRGVTEGEPVIVPPPPASAGKASSTKKQPQPQPQEEEQDEEQEAAASSSTAKGWGLFPDDIVAHLDRFVIGQEEAKKATAIALRSRWRRSQLADDIRQEVAPTNMLFKGPTGSGKTEIARRLSTLAEAPFIKVEATRYTETGFVGENTANMIKGLMDNAVRMEREMAKKRVAKEAREKAEGKVLELLKLPKGSEDSRERLRRGELDHMTVKVTPREKPSSGNPFSDLLDGLDLGSLGSMGPGFSVSIEGRGPAGGPGRRMGGAKERQTLSVKKALERFEEEFAEGLTNDQEVIERAKEKCEQFGIVFIDEIDKLCGGGDPAIASSRASENKGEGVQRELLTLVEGAAVQTRYGTVRTDHILFIASGAFHKRSPSDLLPELQGRFPVRVELKPLDKAALIKILAEKKFNLVEQTKRLMATEGVTLDFTQDGIDEMAGFAEHINRTNQDIGARRLNTVVHRVLEDISFTAPRRRGEAITIDAAFVKERLKSFDPVKENALTKYIL